MSATKYEKGPEILEIPLDDIVQEDNLRSQLTKQDLSELMTSLKQSGQLQPVSVLPTDDGKYRLVFGNRRYTAARKLGWHTIQATVSRATGASGELIEHIVENLHRQDITLSDEGRGYEQLQKAGLSVSEIAARTGKPPVHIQVALRSFHQIPVKWRDKIKGNSGRGGAKKGNISPNLATSVLSIQKLGSGMEKNSETIDKLWAFATEDGVSAAKIRMLGLLLSNGMEFEEAKTVARNLQNLQLNLYMMEDEVRRAEKKYKMPIHRILEMVLHQQTDLPFVDVKERTVTNALKQMEIDDE